MRSTHGIERSEIQELDLIHLTAKKHTAVVSVSPFVTLYNIDWWALYDYDRKLLSVVRRRPSLLGGSQQLRDLQLGNVGEFHTAHQVGDESADERRRELVPSALSGE